MTKYELRVWSIRTHLPDEWWVQVDGQVSDTIVNLDEAFQRANGSDEAFIVHASHAEDTDDPHWVLMGRETSQDDRHSNFDVPRWVCADCKFQFETPDKEKTRPTPGEIIAYLLLIVPGLILTIRRLQKRKFLCPHCGSKKLLEGGSKAAEALFYK